MDDNNLITYILGSILLMMLFASTVIWFLNHAQKKIIKNKLKQQELEISFQKELLLNTVKTQENERSRISKELHDDIASKLSIIHLNLHLLKKKIPKELELDTIINQIETSLKSSNERTRNISHELMPTVLKKFGLEHSLQELESSVNMSKVFDFHIKDMHLIKIEDDFKLLHIYRIIQELMNNAIKYAKCDQVDILFKTENRNLIMIYSDDGIGFDSDKNTNGLGISNINTRINLLHGTIDLNSTIGTGTTLTLKFPNYDEPENIDS